MLPYNICLTSLTLAYFPNRSTQTKGEYLAQCELIVKGVEDSLSRQESSLKAKDDRVDVLKATHQSLVDQQRKYFKAVKDFQEECTKNEWLATKLDQLSHQ